MSIWCHVSLCVQNIKLSGKMWIDEKDIELMHECSIDLIEVTEGMFEIRNGLTGTWGVGHPFRAKGVVDATKVKPISRDRAAHPMSFSPDRHQPAQKHRQQPAKKHHHQSAKKRHARKPMQVKMRERNEAKDVLKGMMDENAPVKATVDALLEAAIKVISPDIVPATRASFMSGARSLLWQLNAGNHPSVEELPRFSEIVT